MTDPQPFRSELQRIRSAVYDHFVEHGSSPAAVQLAENLSMAVDSVDEGLRELAASRAIVLVPGQMRIWMAPPFSAIPTRHRVRVADRQWWAPCMWDALGIPATLGQDGHVLTECPYSRAALELSVANGALRESDGYVHFLVPASEWWTDIGFT